MQTHINNGITNEQELLEKTKDITKLIKLFNEINELKIIYIQYSNKAMCILNNHINNLDNIDINIIDQYLSTLPNYNNYVNNYYTIKSGDINGDNSQEIIIASTNNTGTYISIYNQDFIYLNIAISHPHLF